MTLTNPVKLNVIIRLKASGGCATTEAVLGSEGPGASCWPHIIETCGPD